MSELRGLLNDPGWAAMLVIRSENFALENECGMFIEYLEATWKRLRARNGSVVSEDDCMGYKAYRTACCDDC